VSKGLKVLVIDDEPEIRRFLRVSLTSQNHAVEEAENGAAGLYKALHQRFDLVILDLGLPDVDGVQVLRKIRDKNQVPVIVLSVRNREKDKIEALDAGADDYLTKPFGMGELLARIRVVLKRLVFPTDDPIYAAGDLRVDLNSHVVTQGEREIPLTPTEFDLLKVLVQNAGKVITHRQLSNLVWGSFNSEDGRLLRVNISNLRRKIEPDPSQPVYIVTELGVGYRLKIPAE